MNCKQCGAPAAPDAVFCEHCGEPLEKQNGSAQALTTPQCTAILFAFLVPVLNIILMFVWAYGANTNENIRSLARAGLALLGFFMGIAIAGLSVFILAVRFGILSLSGIL